MSFAAAPPPSPVVNPPAGEWPAPPYTKIAEVPVVRAKAATAESRARKNAVTAARKLVVKGRWAQAQAALEALLAQTSDEAEIHHLLGADDAGCA